MDRSEIKESIISAIASLEEKELKNTLFPIEYDYLNSLNPKQKIAATRLEGNYLVLAGPGAGKTHTLLYRIIHMIKMGIPSKEICVVTFTRRAATQMTQRLNELMPDIKMGFIGTIHALAYTLISRNPKINARLIDPSDDAMILNLAIEESGLRMPPRIKGKMLQKIIDYSVVTMKTIEESLKYLNREELSVSVIETIKETYVRYKQENGYMNYSDVIIQANGSDRGGLQYLLIDEYQDTDPLQLHFFKSLNFPNVMAIGDDFQSIYGFRGADNKNILRFGRDFPNSQMIKLDVNYRSFQEIVDVENEVTNQSDYGYKKNLVSNRGNFDGAVTWGTSLANEIIEAVLDSIKRQELLGEEGSTAVVYRYNRQKYLIEKVLIEKKIDYVVYGGLRLLERKHIKDVCAIMLTNLNKNDFVSYLRSLMLLEGVGEVTAKKIIQGKDFRSRPDLVQLDALIHSKYENVMAVLSDAINFYMGLEYILIKSNYTVEEIEEDFVVLCDLAKNYESLSNFVSDIILDGNKDKWSSKDKKANVYLTTIHSAKGLEFDEVHYIYSPEMVYNLEKAEENRRLFYTAISRAKNYLYVHDEWGRTSFDRILKDFEIDKAGLEKNSESHETDSLSTDMQLFEASDQEIRDMLRVQNENIYNQVTLMKPELKNFIGKPVLRQILDSLVMRCASNSTILFTYKDDQKSMVLLYWRELRTELIPLMEVALKKRLDIICIEESKYNNLVEEADSQF